MSDSPSFEDLLKEEGSAPIEKISKVKADVGKARVDREALARPVAWPRKVRIWISVVSAPTSRPCWIPMRCYPGPVTVLIR